MLVSSNSDSCSVPSRASFWICGALSAVIHSVPSAPRISSRLALVTIPRSETTTTRESPNRALSF